jgi:hypothetical protein
MNLQNTPNHREFLLSVNSVQKHISIRIDAPGVSLGSINLSHITIQAAVYAQSRHMFSKPLVVVNVNDPRGRIERADFQEFMRALLREESIEDLTNESTSSTIFHKYGFESLIQDIWSVFLLRRVRNVFIFQT